MRLALSSWMAAEAAPPNTRLRQTADEAPSKSHELEAVRLMDYRDGSPYLHTDFCTSGKP